MEENPKLYLDENNKRIAVILNHNEFEHIGKESPEERLGTDFDVYNLQLILPSLKYDLIIYNNPQKDEIMKLADTLMRVYPDKFSRWDSLLVVILTHGEIEATIAAFDHYYDLNEFINTFHPNCFKLMENKSKIFFISSCRGKDECFAVPKHSKSNIKPDYTETESKQSFNLYSGAAVIFGTNANEKGFRDTNYGTYFVQEATATLDNFLRDKSIQTLEVSVFFTIMNSNLIRRCCKTDGSAGKQISQMLNSLEEPYYFIKN